MANVVYNQDGDELRLDENLPLTLDQYQHGTGMTAVYPKDRAVEYLLLGLASEVGEALGKAKKLIRDNTDYKEYRKAFLYELGDILWYVARLADEHDSSLEKVATANLSKLLDRMERDQIKGEGDER